MINFEAIEKIDKSKQNEVREICNLLVGLETIKRLVVFGSAADNTCTEASDLDLCLDTELAANDNALISLYKNISRLCGYNCDILRYGHISETLRQEIETKGVVVYEA